MKTPSMSRIRSEVKKGANGSYLGTFPSYEELIAKYPNKVGNKKGNKDDLLTSTFDSSSFAYVDDGISDPIQYKYDGKKWKKINGSGSVGKDDRYKGYLLDITELKKITNPNEGDWALVYDSEDLSINMWMYEATKKDWVQIVDESSTLFKGVFPSFEALELRYPTGKEDPTLFDGDFAIVNQGKNSTGLDLMIYAKDRLTFVQISQANIINHMDLKGNIFLKNYGTIEPANGNLRFRKDNDTSKILIEQYDDESKQWYNVAGIGSYTSNLFEINQVSNMDTVNMWDGLGGDRHNIWRRYVTSTEVMNEYGSLNRNSIISVKDSIKIAKQGNPINTFSVKNCVNDNWDVVKDKRVAKGYYEYTILNTNNIEMYECKLRVHTEYARVRLQIFDIKTELCIYDSCRDHAEFLANRGKIIKDKTTGATTGLLHVKLAGSGYMIANTSYKLRFSVSEGELIGDTFPDIQFFGTDWSEGFIATEEWVQSQPFSHQQSLQDTLTTGNIMSADTNIRLLGVDNSETFDITKTNVTYTNNGHIDFDENGYLFSSINLSTVTPRETSMLTINLNPTANISPKLVTFHVDSVPNKPINLPDNIFFTVTEVDNTTTRIPHKYNINTEVTPMVGIFSIKLDGREIKNISMTVMKGSTNSFPNFTGWGYMKVIKGYSGTFANLFEKEDGRYILNPTLIKAGTPSDVYWDAIKNKPEILPEVVDDKLYSRSKGKWVEAVKQNVFAFGDKKNYLLGEFASYENKLYRCIKNTFRSPDYTYTSKIDTPIPNTSNTVKTIDTHSRMMMFQPFISHSDCTITGFRLNVDTTSLVDNCYICLGERGISTTPDAVRVISMEKFTLLNGDNAYTLKTPLTVSKDKKYELIGFINTLTPSTIGSNEMSVVENSQFKVGLISGNPYTCAYDQRETGTELIPVIGADYRYHQGTWSLGMLCLSPIVESTTVKDWVEVVSGGGIGGAVDWKDVVNKPSDLLTEILLTTTNHKEIPILASGVGITCDGSSLLSSETFGTRVGNRDELLSLDAQQIINRRFTGESQYLLQQINVDTVNVDDPTVKLIIQNSGTKITDILLDFKKECKIKLMLDGNTLIENYQCVIGNNRIPVKVNGYFRAGDEPLLLIMSDTPQSISGHTVEGEYSIPYYGYVSDEFTEGRILSDTEPTSRFELQSSMGSIVTSNGSGLDNKIISLGKGEVIFGSEYRTASIKSDGGIKTSITSDRQVVASTDFGDVILGSTFQFQIPNQFVGYSVIEASVVVQKKTRINLRVNGNRLGDGKRFQNEGEIFLRPTSPILTEALINIDISTSAENVLFGKTEKIDGVDKVTPRVVLTLAKVTNSEVADKYTARNIDLPSKDNLIVHGDVIGERFNYDLNTLRFIHNGATPIIELDPSDTKLQRIMFNGNYGDFETNPLTIQMNGIQPNHFKTRIEAYFDFYQNNGFVEDILLSGDAIKVTSLQGRELNSEVFIKKCSIANTECHIYFDYNVDDSINIEFGKGNNLTNCHSLLVMNESSGNKVVGKFAGNVFNDDGRISSSALPFDSVTMRDLDNVKEYSKRINIRSEENLLIENARPTSDFDMGQLVNLKIGGGCSHTVSDVATLDTPINGTLDKQYTTKYLAKSNITNGYIRTRISDYGGIYVKSQDFPIRVIYEIFGSNPITLNQDTINLLDEQGNLIATKKTIESSNNNALITLEASSMTPVFILEFGVGNDISNSEALMRLSMVVEEQYGTPLLGTDGKINPLMYEKGSWDKHLNLVKNENIYVTIRNGLTEFYAGNLTKVGAWTGSTEQQVGASFNALGSYSLINEIHYKLYSTDSPLPSNYTDNESTWKLKITNGLETKWIPLICTTGKPNEVNIVKLKGFEIYPQEWKFDLICTPVQSEFGYSPNYSFRLELMYPSTTERTLFNETQKIDPIFIEPQDQSNRFNEIELYPIPNPLDSKKIINPSIVYDSSSYGKLNVISGAVGKMTETNISNYFSEVNLYSGRKRGVTLNYLDTDAYIQLGEALDTTPISGTSWKTIFNNTFTDKNVLVGMEMFALGNVKFNVKVKSVSSGDILVDRNYDLTSRELENPSEIYVLMTQTELDKVNIEIGEYEVIVTRLSDSGNLYGTIFPASRAILSSIKKDEIATLEVIKSQMKYQTSNSYFMLGEADKTGVIIGLNDSENQDLQCDDWTIPVRNMNGANIIGVAPNVFNYDRVNGRTIIIEANLNNVHPSNFKNSEGVQCCKLICNPNNPSYLYLTGLGYTIDGNGGVPNPSIPNAHLTTDANGVMTWATTSNNVGDVYLSATMRIKAVGTNFVFETLIDSTWTEVGKMGL